jgi:type I restriction enzyme, S subunit
MKLDQLLDHFDHIANVPDAIPSLRRLILDLAVRGKLVDQNPKDEPASELLKRIQAEKARQIKTGEIRKEKPIPLVGQDEALFDTPAGWEWVRIRQVTSDRGQTIPENEFTYIDVTAINKTAGRVDKARILSASEAPSRARKLVRTGDVLYSYVRPYLLNIAIIEHDIFPMPIASTAFAVLNGFNLVLPKYLWITLRSPFMVERVEAKMRGQAYPAINDSDFALLPLPLPPLAEQHRIIAKVDELMALCDYLETAQAERESQRERLATACLNRLNNSADAFDFRKQARFYLDNLARLTIHPEQISALRKTILNLAVRGKLVPQDPNDESASELLKQIQVEQDDLVRAGAIKQNISNPRLSEVDIPFNIPTNWQWVTLRNLIVFGPQNGISPKPSSRADAPKAITLTATTKGAFDPRHFKHVDATIPQDSEFWLRSGDLLFQRGNTREYVGIAAYYIGEPHLFLYPDLMMKVRLSQKVELRYVHLYAVAPYARNYFSTHASGAQATMPKINQATLLQLPIPIPPLAEQRRIVTKVEELLSLCDRLEMVITTAQTENRQFLEAIINHVLGTTPHRVREQKLAAIMRGEEWQDHTHLTSSLEPKLHIPDLQFMSSNPIKTVAQLVECLSALGGVVEPEHLLNATGLRNYLKTKSTCYMLLLRKRSFWSWQAAIPK